MEGENHVNRLKVQRLESRRKTRDIYKVVGCLMPYRLCALISAQLKLSSVRFTRQWLLLYDLRGSRRYTEITKLTHRLRIHSRRLIHESSFATATGICNYELPWTSMEFQALMYIKIELLFR
jgi:hypothetical protein